jgi:hypothetical protein
MNFFLKRPDDTTPKRRGRIIFFFAPLRLCAFAFKKTRTQDLIPPPASIHCHHTGVGANSIRSSGISPNQKIVHAPLAQLRRTHFNFLQFQVQRFLVCVRCGAIALFRWWQQRFIFQRKDAKAQRRKEEENYSFHAFEKRGLA